MESERLDNVLKLQEKIFIIDNYIKSEEFYNFIYDVCYEACNTNKEIIINENTDIKLKVYLYNFFEKNYLGYGDKELSFKQKCSIKIILYNNITFADIYTSYFDELDKLNKSSIERKKVKHARK